jgi:hypothetical protein
MSKYLSCAETAGLVRKALKEAFPDIKFSVRSSTYSGGASIRVRWVDGPNVAQVEAVTKVFEGSYFDGSIDFKGRRFAMVDGEQVRFGADFIFCNRDASPALIGKAIAAVCRFYGIKEVPPAEDFNAGRLNGVPLPGGETRDMRDMVWRQLSKMSDRLAVMKSKTAGKVIYLGNDGYSQRGALDAGALA